MNIWDLRLDRQEDGQTGPLPHARVEMRGTAINGFVCKGDWVGVDATWREGRVIRTRSLRNLTSHTTVRVKREYWQLPFGVDVTSSTFWPG
jgi:hypothetical protein